MRNHCRWLSFILSLLATLPGYLRQVFFFAFREFDCLDSMFEKKKMVSIMTQILYKTRINERPKRTLISTLFLAQTVRDGIS